MPAHIAQRVGRYEDAAEANCNGVAADLAYFSMTKPLDYYIMYTSHNYQFLRFSAAMEGRKSGDDRGGAPVARIGLGRDVADDAGRRLVCRRALCGDGPFRHVGRYSGRAGAKPEADRVERRLSLRKNRSAGRQRPGRGSQSLARRTRNADRFGNRRRQQSHAGCARDTREQGPHRPRGEQQRRNDRVTARGDREGGQARLLRTGKLVLSEPTYPGCRAGQLRPGG